MKRKITAVLAAALSLTLVACANPKEFSDDEAMIKKYTRSDDVSVTYNYADGAEEPPAAYNSYANAVSAFSFKELAALAAVKKESFVCSPVSSALQLGMLANGASGNTRQDILLAFGAEFSLGEAYITGYGGVKENKENAIKFLEFLTRKDVAELYQSVAMNISTIKDVASDSIPASADWGKITALPVSGTYTFYDEVNKIMDPLLTNLVTGDLTVEEYCDQLQAAQEIDSANQAN